MTDYDVKNYLDKIYKIPFVQISSMIKCGKIEPAPGKNYLIKSTDDYRLVDVYLKEGMTFKFPNVFPEKIVKEQDSEEEAFQKVMERDKIISKRDSWKRGHVPSWFGI